MIAAISLTLAWLAVLTLSVQQSGALSQGLLSSWARLTSLSSWPAWRRARWPCPRPAAGPGDRGVAASLPHDRGPVRRLRVPLDRSAGAPGRAVGRSCLPPAGRPGDRAGGRRHAVPGPVGRRVAGLVAAGLLPSLAATLPSRLYGGPAAWLVILAVAVLVWPVAIVSWRGRVRRASRAG